MAWLARDSDKIRGDLYLFENKPIKKGFIWRKSKGEACMVSWNFDKIYLNRKITWEDEPVEIEIKEK